MSARRPLPPLDSDTLARMPVQVVVRDYPETLAVLRGNGVDLAASGGETVRRLVASRGADLLPELTRALRWRASLKDPRHPG